MNSENRVPLRVRLAVIILCGVFAASLASFFNVQRRCGRLYSETERTLGILSDGVPQSALDEAAASLGTLWQREQPWLALLISGEMLSGLGQAVNRLPAETSEPDTMRAELLALRAAIAHLLRQERSVF